MDKASGVTNISIGLLRHSRTVWNEKKMLQGQQDSPLSSKGQQMAIAWGKQLSSFGWDMILSSDLGRAVATAELINTSLNIPIHTNKKLREQDWGRWTGLTLEEIKKDEKRKLKQEIKKGWFFTPPGGESRKQVLNRATSAIVDCGIENPEKKILVLCHEGVIKCLIYSVLQRDFLPDEKKILAPYNLHLISVDDGAISLSKINSYQLPFS
jgi:probable phosphoglycerate mutase